MSKLYCLSCFTRTERNEKTCPVCGYRTNSWERRVYWNRAPLLVLLERVLKLVVVMLSVAGVALLFMIFPDGSGTGSGFFFVTPVIVGGALWATVSKLTHRGRYFSPVVFWTSALGLCLGGGLLGGYPIQVAPYFLVAGALVYALGKRLASWKAGLMQGRPRQ